MFAQSRSLVVLVLGFLVLSAAVAVASAQVSFANPVSYKVGTAPVAVAVGDFNGDGKPDLAVLNSGNAAIGDDGGVSILLGNGDGTFQFAKNISAGKNAVAILAADFNHDGKLDLVVSRPQSVPGFLMGSASILLANGDGTFQAPIDIMDSAVGALVGLVSAGDFNGDGNADLAFIDSVDSVAVLLGNGDGTFQPCVDYPVGDTANRSIDLTVGDINGDHKLGLAARVVYCSEFIHECETEAVVLLGTGEGTFGQGVGTLDGDGEPVVVPGGFATGDFNGDGKPDLAGSGGTGFTILLNTGNGTFALEPAPALYNIQFFSLAGLGDIDGDGKLDLISTASVALGNEDGTFQTPVAFSFPGITSVADVNGDGLSDALWVDPSNNVVNVILNTTPGFSLKPSPSSMTVTAGGSATYTIDVVQQNGFASAASLACSAPASVGIQCSVSPSSTSPGSSIKLTVTTTGLAAALSLPGNRGNTVLFGLWLPVAGFAVFGVGLGSPRKPRKKLLGLLPFCLLFASLTFLLACGGASNNGGASSATPSGNYTITVTGTAGSLQRSTTVTLSVR